MGNNTNIAQINIFVSERERPHANNGYYALVFQEELDAIVREKEMKDSTFRVLGYLIAHVDNKNYLNVSTKEIAKDLGFSLPTIYRALETLIRMQLICQKSESRGSSRYELSSKLLNPRLAYYGNSQKLIKAGAPVIMCPNGNIPLLPNEWSFSELQIKQTDNQNFNE